MGNEDRPDPQTLLRIIKQQEKKEKDGHLKIFFGMSAGVGKTFTMLSEAQNLLREGVDVVVGVVETHGRKETEELLQGLEIIPRVPIEYRDRVFNEMDLDLILKRMPKLVLVDELGHSNIVGSRHPKRWQDVMELLDAGINVYTTLNVQHLESRKDFVEKIAGITIRETVPDLVLERSVEIELIDITPTELLKRLKEGKIYLGGQSVIAAQNFFQEDRLTALRELALRFTAEKVDHELHEMMSTSTDFSRSWKTTERLMVGVSPCLYSQQLIRSARRIAFNMDAPWIACYVDTGEPLDEEERENLTANLSLARGLGAEVVTVTDPDITRTLQRVAKQRNISQIIIGRYEERFWKELFSGGSILDRITREKSDTDVLVIRQPSPVEIKKKARPRTLGALQLTALWKALALVAGLFIFGHVTKSYIGYVNIGFIFLLCIIAMGLFVRKSVLIVTAVISSLVWYFFIVPSGKLGEPIRLEDLAIPILFIFSALVIGSLKDRLRISELLLRSREQKSQALYDIVKEIANARSSSQLIKGIQTRLESLLKGKCEILLLASENDHFQIENSDLVDDEKEKAVAFWVFKNGKLAGWSTDTLSSVKNVYIPLKSSQVLGVIAFIPDFKRKLGPEEINLLQTVAQHLANYLWRTNIEEKALKSEYLGKIEKIHSIILKSLSSLEVTREGSLQTVKERLTEAPANPMLKQIRQSSENLQHLVENLLAMTKLTSGFFKTKFKQESVTNLINSCLASLRKVLANHLVETHVEEDLPLVSMDFDLMELLLSNILINAAENSPPGSMITVNAVQKFRRLIITISDEGTGIPPEVLEKAFEKFHLVPGSSTARAGLGLAIAKDIVEVHKGSIKARNRPGVGAEIIVEIPIA